MFIDKLLNVIKKSHEYSNLFIIFFVKYIFNINLFYTFIVHQFMNIEIISIYEPQKMFAGQFFIKKNLAFRIFVQTLMLAPRYIIKFGGGGEHG